mmetsp:Transcript_17772/g.50358  ORF Transcript_17772/g.50358 Transcript_17772/m.50358 type:complete len:214 (-) Transcript_17772:448-1089(-)
MFDDVVDAGGGNTAVAGFCGRVSVGTCILSDTMPCILVTNTLLTFLSMSQLCAIRFSSINCLLSSAVVVVDSNDANLMPSAVGFSMVSLAFTAWLVLLVDFFVSPFGDAFDLVLLLLPPPAPTERLPNRFISDRNLDVRDLLFDPDADDDPAADGFGTWWAAGATLVFDSSAGVRSTTSIEERSASAFMESSTIGLKLENCGLAEISEEVRVE